MIVVVVWLAVIEGVGWIIDARTGHRAMFLKALSIATPSAIPVSRPPGLSLPERFLMVRDAQDEEGTGQPYSIGGQLLPTAHIKPRLTMLTPEDLEGEERIRVALVGGSAAFGYTARHDQCLGGLLTRELRQTHRVINAAQVGWTSGQLLPIVERLTGHFGVHILIIFTGNNEWVKWVAPNQHGIGPGRLKLYRTLAHSRALAEVLYHGVNRAIRNRKAVEAGRPEFAIHQELEGYRYALSHPADLHGPYDTQSWYRTRKTFLDAYEQNLRAMINLARASGARVVLLNMPYRYNLSVAWKHPQPEAFDAAVRDRVKARLQQAATLVEGGQCEAALEQLDAALKLDPLPPILHYLRGQCLEKLSRLSEAEAAYGQSRENMVGNLGSMGLVNERMAHVASSTGAEFVDVKQLFDDFEHRAGGCCNKRLILDDCHPAPLGHALIAREVLRRLRAMPFGNSGG